MVTNVCFQTELMFNQTSARLKIDIREKYFNVDSLKVLFKIKEISLDINNFLKERNIFYNLYYSIHHYSTSCKFLIRNTYLVLVLNCLNV